MGQRIKIEGKQLATVIYLWLRALPKWAWGEEPDYARLKKQRRHDPSQEPDPQHLAAELIAAKLQELDWEVSYEERGNIFQHVAERRKE
jgi:hypothetical protein